MEGSVEKVFPSIEALSAVSKGIKCPDCSAVFNSDSHLNLHLAKTHKKAEFLLPSSITKIYHCPIVSCSYHESSHFKQLKLLKQHFLKVHSEKKFICSSCNKGFSTEAFKDRHLEYCNAVFKCCDCDAYYNCYETLKTHGRRKKHTVLEKSSYKVGQEVLRGPKSETSVKHFKLILPKVSKSTGMIVVLNTSEQSSQTENGKISQSSQETQTQRMKTLQLTIETQTIGDYYTKKPEIINLKCSKTQTNIIEPKSVSCNTSLNINELDLEINEVHKSSSSTQTSINDCSSSDLLYSSSTSTHDSIHTDTSDLLTDTLDSNFFNCNMETQTDFMFNDELFKYDFYSNMHTQTCEDLLLGEIGLNDTHTQTVFDDVLKSVESQTIMSQSRRVSFGCKDMSHMDTQTDMEYMQILEEINA